QFDLSTPAANPAWISWNEAEGRLSLEVPAEHLAPVTTGLKVKFPINDNSVKGSSADFEIGVSISGGEINFGALPTFGSEFASETAAGRNDGGKTAFEINHESGSGSLSSVVGTTQLSLSEIDPGVVSDVYVSWPGGSRTFSEGDWNVIGSGLELTGLPIESDYSVEITYRQPADDAEAALIAAAKENVGVSASVISSGKAVSVNVVDEPSAEQDVISLSYALDPASLDASGNIVEGSEVAGVVNVQMPNLTGDHGVVAGDVSFSFQMPSEAAGQSYNINWADSLPNGVNVNPIIDRPGFYQIEIEAGSPIPADGNFQIGFAIEAGDNALLANPEFRLGIGNPSAPAYEGIKIAAGSGADATAWKLVDEAGAADGPAFSVEASATQIVEGSAFSFSISSDADPQIWQQAAGRPVNLEITLDGLSAGDQVQLSNGSWYTVQADDSGAYTLSWPVTPSPAGDMPEITLNVRAADLETLNPDRKINARVSGVDTFEGFSSGSAGVAVNTSNHVELSLARGAFNQTSQSMMFTIALAAAGFDLSNGGLPEDVKLTLNLGEMTETEKEALAAELSARPGVAAVYAEEDDRFEITLEQGYADSALEFEIPVSQTGEYNVRIEGVEGSGLLAAPKIDAAANGEVFSRAQGEGAVQNLGSEDDPRLMETVNGGSGDDILIAADGISSLLLGEDGDDILIGASGDDILQGGRGNDIMSGGAGENTFLWNKGDLGGVDNILDLKEVDNIDLRDLFSDVEMEEGGLSVQALLDNGYLSIEENSSDAAALDIKISASGQVDTAAEQIITVNFADTSLDQEQQMEQLIQQVLLVTDS
ncbi:MAG: hypothetical protein IJD04_07135, partial [Desulfovibrionaceae bacterium]|nr:hypothetical protein [Desulfovibrionaceae bacterium]